jgi:serine/threonine-protein phosphatase 2A regulatory subunit B'
LPDLPALSNPNFSEVFGRKIEICEQTFTFSGGASEKVAIGMKTQALTEIMNLVRRSRSPIPDSVVAMIFRMVEKNILRPISFDGRLLWSTDSPQIVDPAWPHLSLVYEVLKAVADVMPTYTSFAPPFFQALRLPGDTPDANERAAIVGFFGALFRNGKHLRQQVVEIYESALIDYSATHNRSPFFAWTALEILGYIAEHTVPLLPCSDRAFTRAVLPLLGDGYLPIYVAAVEHLFAFFLEDRPSYSVPALKRLVTVFPHRNVRLQRALLGLIEVAVERRPKGNQDLVVPIARVIIAAGESQNESLAQAALKMWGRPGIERLLSDQRPIVLPLLVPSLSRVMVGHWSPSVRGTAKSCLASFQQRESKLVRECILEQSASMGSGGATPPEARKWLMLTKAAYGNDQQINVSATVQRILALFKEDRHSFEMTGGVIPLLPPPRANSERMKVIVPRVV